jgi:multidrug resistance protein, MATE family
MIPAARKPIVELLTLAIPTVAQMASYTLMQFVDTWILSRLGTTPPTAASNSGILAFALISFGMGTVVIVNTLVSQAYGRGDRKACGSYMWQGIWLGLLMGICFFPLRLLADPIFHAFGHPLDQAAMEAAYYRIVLWTAPLKLIATAIGQFSIAIDRAAAVTAAAFVGVSINALAAWAVVLGHFGFASHGIAGAAWAQNIGVSCELLSLIVFALPKRICAEYGIANLVLRARELLILIKVGIPSGLQFFNDVFAWSIFCNAVIGLLGPAAMAANAFMLRYMVVSFLPAIGIGTAVTALVGRYIGRGEPDVAIKRADLAFGIALLYILTCGACFVVFRHALIALFTVDPEVIHIGGIYLILAAIYEISDAMYIIYTGALRGAGDTLRPALVGAALCWSITVTGGYLAARLHLFGPAGPWVVACVYGQLLGFYVLTRFKGRKWQAIDLRSDRKAEELLATDEIPMNTDKSEIQTQKI